MQRWDWGSGSLAMAIDLIILEVGFRLGMTALAVLLFAAGMVAGWAAHSVWEKHHI